MQFGQLKRREFIRRHPQPHCRNVHFGHPSR
jgi:hypothetical protein